MESYDYNQRIEIYEVVPGHKRGSSRMWEWVGACTLSAIGTALTTWADDRREAGLTVVPTYAIKDTLSGTWLAGPAPRDGWDTVRQHSKAVA